MFTSTHRQFEPAVEDREALLFVARALCSDLAEESRAAASHPFVGRQREITAVLETLCRKLKGNPLLIGKPGVGKTALVMAVASKLCQGEVPARLMGGARARQLGYAERSRCESWFELAPFPGAERFRIGLVRQTEMRAK